MFFFNQANEDPKMCRTLPINPHQRIIQGRHSTVIRFGNGFSQAERHEPPMLPAHTIHRAPV